MKVNVKEHVNQWHYGSYLGSMCRPTPDAGLAATAIEWQRHVA